MSVLEGLSMVSPSRQWALFWFNLRYICFSAIPVLWLIFVLQYMGKSSLVTKERVAFLFIIPAVTQVVLWTNNLHGLWVERDVAFHQVGFFSLIDGSVRIAGFWMNVYMLYSYVLLLTGMILLAIMIIRLSRKDRIQTLTVGAGALIMIIGSLFPTLNLIPGMSFNPLTVSYAIGSLVIAWGVFRGGFLQSTPVMEHGKGVSLVLMVVFLMLAGTIIFSGYVYYNQFEKNYRVEVERKLSAVVELKIDELVQWRKERLADASVLYNNIAFARLIYQMNNGRSDNDVRKTVKDWLTKIQASYDYKNVLLLDAAGALRVSAVDATEEEYRAVKMHIGNQHSWEKIVFVDFHRIAPEKPVYLMLLIPIVDNGRNLGIVVMLIDPERFLYPMVQRWPTPSKTGETLLVRREGDDVLYLNNLKFQKNAALNIRLSLKQDYLPAARAVGGYKGIMEGYDYRGEKVIAALAAVPDSPWFMVSRIDMAEIFAPSRERFWVMALFIVILIAGAGMIVWLLWQRQRGVFYRKELESANALRTSEEKFRKAFMTSPDAIAITRLADGLVVSVNAGFCRITGYAEAEVTGKKVQEILIWENDQDRKNMIAKLQSEGIVQNEEARFRKKNGAVVYGLYSTAVIELDGVAHILMITRDITERILTEKALQASEKQLREAQEMAHLGFWSWDIKTGNVEWSKEVFKIFGLDPQEFTPHIDSILALSPWPDDHERGRELIKRATENHRPGFYEQKFLRPDQSTGYYYSTFQGNYDVNGGLISIVGTVLDITERKLAEKKIEELNVELEQKVLSRTAELSAKTVELERINKVFVDRELRMRELKARIAELENT